MASDCIICSNKLKPGEATIKLLNGMVKKNDFGGYQFIQDDAFEVQGYVHAMCMMNMLREKADKKPVETKITTFI